MQGEDEIASIGMCLGAAMAGAKAMNVRAAIMMSGAVSPIDAVMQTNLREQTQSVLKSLTPREEIRHERPPDVFRRRHRRPAPA